MKHYYFKTEQIEIPLPEGEWIELSEGEKLCDGDYHAWYNGEEMDLQVKPWNEKTMAKKVYPLSAPICSRYFRKAEPAKATIPGHFVSEVENLTDQEIELIIINAETELERRREQNKSKDVWFVGGDGSIDSMSPNNTILDNYKSLGRATLTEEDARAIVAYDKMIANICDEPEVGDRVYMVPSKNGIANLTVYNFDKTLKPYWACGLVGYNKEEVEANYEIYHRRWEVKQISPI